MKPTHEFLVDQVEKKLFAYLEEKKIKIGDLIPKEMELVEILGVSRTVVREALSRLRTQGLLETRRRRGTILTSPDVSVLLSKNLHPGLLDDDTLKELFEMRLSLEIGMAELIMQRKTKKDLADLHSIVQEEPVNTNTTFFDKEHEVKFHGKLYSITRNESMMKFQELLLPIFEFVHHSGLIKRSLRNENFVSHSQIVDTIEKGNTKDLQNAMHNHLSTHFHRIFN